MGALARNLIWTNSPAGDPDGWPPTLRTIVSLVLHSRSPMYLFWGNDFIQFFNDAYCDLFQLPELIHASFGRSARQDWGADFEELEKIFQSVFNGDSFISETLIERKRFQTTIAGSSTEYNVVFD